MKSRRGRVRSLLMQEILESRRPLAVDTYLLKDINDQPVDVSLAPRNLTRVGPHVYFTATTPSQGTELWRTDGTVAGTNLVKDIWPSFNGSSPTNLTNVNGRLYFTANDGIHGNELWSSDGSVNGTRLVADVNVGINPSSINSLTGVGNRLYFVNGANKELWVSSGTSGSTKQVPGVKGPASYLTNLEGTLYFVSTESNYGMLVAVKEDVAAYQSLALKFWSSAIDLNGSLYFITNGIVNRFEPYGKPGRFWVTVHGGHSQLHNANGRLFYTRQNGSIFELETTEGTTTTNTLLGTFKSINNLVNVGSTLYFVGETDFRGAELWKSDGTVSGTQIVKDISLFDTSYPFDLTVVGNTLYFRADNGTNGTELWKSDGSESGTVMVRDIMPGPFSNILGTRTTRTMAALGDRLIFSPDFADLWVSDGTSGGTTRISDPFQSGGSSNASSFVSAGNLYFFAATSAVGSELWATDGTSDGTRLVKDINPGAAGSAPRYITNVNGQVYFKANDGASGWELWKSDGTADGTIRVADIAAGATGSQPSNLVNVNGTLYFSANNGTAGYELWKSNGTAAGTAMVKDIRAGASSSSPLRLFNHHGTLFFSASAGSNDTKLWKSDGTDAGTVVLQVTPSNFASFQDNFTSLGDSLLFVDDRDGKGRELWISDGTVAGTVLLKDIRTPSSSSPQRLTSMGGKVYFYANDGSIGTELWVTDGTASGTSLVKDFISGSASFLPTSMVAVGSTLYVAGRDLQNNEYFLKSDGTAVGTALIGNQRVTQMANVSGQLTMVVESVADDPRLWKSDGTGNGTQLITTVSGQSVRLMPSTTFSNIGETIFYTSHTQTRGGELYVLSAVDLGDSPTQTLASGNGARHAAWGPTLGALRDTSEADGLPSHLSQGDDLAGSDDDDGADPNLSLPFGSTTTLTVQVSAADTRSKLSGWIDWNQDGDWNDLGERVITNATVSSGANLFSITPPAGAKAGPTAARLRLANQENLGPTGLAYSGEVEDYTWQAGNSAVLQLPNSSANSIVIRLSGANLQVIDVPTSNVLFDTSLANLNSLRIVGSNSQADDVHLDFSAGGFFSLAGGLDFTGLGGGSDVLKITGISGATVEHTAPAVRGSLPQFTFKSGSNTIDVRYSNFEELNVNQWKSFVASDRFDIGSATYRITTIDAVQLSNDNRISGGLLVADRVNLPASATLTGYGTLNARFNGGLANQIVLTGPMTLGSATDTDGFANLGLVSASVHMLTLLDSNVAELGYQTNIGSGSTPGRLVASNGLKLDAGETIQGFGTIDSPNDETKPFMLAGSVVGSDLTQRITVAGYVIGRGTMIQVIASGTVSPGGLGLTNYGSVAFTGRLIMEVGGTNSSNEFDWIHFGGEPTPGGIFEVRLVNGFVPTVGQTFDIFSSAIGGLAAFTSTVYPTLSGNARWQVTGSPYDQTLRVIDIGLTDLPETVLENDGPVTVWVTRPAGATTDALTINLTSSDPSELQVPATVTIPAGQTSASFQIVPTDDTLLDREQLVTISGSATGYVGFTRAINVEDHETLSISFASSSVVEGTTVVGTLTRNNTDLDESVQVSLFSFNNILEPVVVVIPAGQKSVNFSVAPPDRNTMYALTGSIQAVNFDYEDEQESLTVLGSESLKLVLNQSLYAEGQEAAYGIVTRPIADSAVDLPVSLVSSDTTEITVVGGMIRAGDTTAIVTLDIRTDGSIDGLQMVTIASKPGDLPVSVTVGVTDDLVVAAHSQQSVVREDVKQFTGIVLRGNTTGTVNVSLQSTHPKVQVPSSVSIPQGLDFSIFPITILDNALLDGTVEAEIIPTLNGYTAQSSKFTILDHETLTVTLSDYEISETESSVITVTRSNTDISQPLAVNLMASGWTSAPGFLLIPAGKPSATFTTSSNNGLFNHGTRSAIFTAEAPGYASIPAELTITENDMPTFQLDRSSIVEGKGPVLATIQRAYIDLSNPFTIWLSTNDVTEVDLPDSVTIPPGQNSVTFPIYGVDDAILDGSKTVTLTAMISPYKNVYASLIVKDSVPLELSIDPLSIVEGTTAVGTVKRIVLDASQPMTVTIESDNSGQVSVPASVVIPAGATTATFTISGLNDDLLDGVQTARITVSSPDAIDGFRDITVTDNESLSLAIAPLSISERGGLTVGTISRGTTALDQSILVTLTSSDTSEATVPTTVTIPAGQGSTTFNITAIDDTLLDGSQPVTILATAVGFFNSQATLTVTDSEQLALSADVTIVSENGGQVTITVARSNDDTSQPVTVSLSSSDRDQFDVPPTVTIAADHSSVSFTALAIDDSLLDGTQVVIVSATATGYEEGTVSISVTDFETLTITPSSGSFRETDGTTQASVRRSNTDTAAELTVTLNSSDTSAATVPATVKILSGQAEAFFTITIIDDSLLDGTQPVTVRAAASGYVDGTSVLQITDVETLTLSVSTTSISEKDGSTLVTITRNNTDISAALVVQLTSSDTTEATVPSSVTIPAGVASATFTVTAVDDTLLDGTQQVTIVASSTGYEAASSTVQVTDYETLSLSVLSTSISEKDGSTLVTITRSNTDLSAALVVQLTSSDTTEATMPASVTISAGLASANFTVTAVDDTLLDGTQSVTIVASENGYQDASSTLQVTDYETLSLSVSSTSISEKDGSTLVTISRNNTDVSAALVVQLTSSDTTEVTVPVSVTIPAGLASATFTVTAVDDTLLDGTQPVTILASSTGYEAASLTVQVTDYETLSLSVLSTSISEKDGSTLVTITRNNTDVSAALVVQLTSSDTTEATVPASVTIPAGVASATFTVTAVDDTLLDGTQSVTIVASSTGYEAASSTVQVTDYETLSLSVLSTSISEKDGSTLVTITRSNTDTSAALVVQLSSSDTTEATVPASVTIPAGVVLATFTVTAVDDTLLDGTQSVTIVASENGYQDASSTLQVTDYETLSLSVLSTSISEKDGSTLVTITRSNTDTSAALVVQLSSSDTTEATVPASVTIPAGVVLATFTVTAVDDTLLDGAQSVTIVASSTGYEATSSTVQVTDYETLSLSVSSTTISEKDGSTLVTITRNNTDISAALLVQLTSNDTTEATVPASVTIPAGVASATFTVTVVNDTLLDGTQSVSILASSAGYEAASSTVQVTDYETLSLSVSSTSISEKDGSTLVTISRNNTDLGNSLVVQLISSDSSEATVPVSVTIPAGVASATFTVTAIDDALLDGTQSVTLDASAAGYEATSALLQVTDLETLSLSLDSVQISEKGGSTVATVTRSNADTTNSLEVQLSSSDTTEAAISAVVVIPAGQASVTFVVAGVDDTVVDGTIQVTILAQAVGYAEASAQLSVNDNDRLRPWQSPRNPLDVNDSGQVTALDALLVIDAINSRLVLTTILPDPFEPVRYVDVNGDGILSPIDALLVINELNRQVGQEGEADVGIENPSTITQDIADGWQLQVDWLDLNAPDSHPESQAFEADRGRNLITNRIIARRRLQINLDEPISSIPGNYRRADLRKPFQLP